MMDAMDIPGEDGHATEVSAAPPRDATGSDDAVRVMVRAGTYHGSIRAVQGERYVVVCPAGVLYALAAASCLIVPQVGDRVLLSCQADEHFVLAVLRRADAAQAQLRLGGDVTLHADSLRVEAPSGMSLETDAAFSMRAGQASLGARALLLDAHSLQANAYDMALTARHRRDVSVSRRDVAARVESHHGDSVRRVSGHDEQAVGSSRIVVAREWRVRADRADILARRRVKLDADKVDLG